MFDHFTQITKVNILLIKHEKCHDRSVGRSVGRTEVEVGVFPYTMLDL